MDAVGVTGVVMGDRDRPRGVETLSLGKGVVPCLVTTIGARCLIDFVVQAVIHEAGMVDAAGAVMAEGAVAI